MPRGLGRDNVCAQAGRLTRAGCGSQGATGMAGTERWLFRRSAAILAGLFAPSIAGVRRQPDGADLRCGKGIISILAEGLATYRAT